MGTRILLIDDDPKLVPLLERGLAYEGFEVLTAGDGESGLELADARRPHVVLLDIAMPDPDGFEVCRRLRLLDQVWGFDQPDSSVLDVHIGHLRQKLEAAGGSRLIHTIRGIGYALRG